MQKKPILYDLVAWVFPRVIEYAHDNVARWKGFYAARVQFAEKLMEVIMWCPAIRSSKERLRNGATEYKVIIRP